MHLVKTSRCKSDGIVQNGVAPSSPPQPSTELAEQQCLSTMSTWPIPPPPSAIQPLINIEEEKIV